MNPRSLLATLTGFFFLLALPGLSMADPTTQPTTQSTATNSTTRHDGGPNFTAPRLGNRGADGFGRGMRPQMNGGMKGEGGRGMRGEMGPGLGGMGRGSFGIRGGPGGGPGGGAFMRRPGAMRGMQNRDQAQDPDVDQATIAMLESKIAKLSEQLDQVQKQLNDRNGSAKHRGQAREGRGRRGARGERAFRGGNRFNRPSPRQQERADGRGNFRRGQGEFRQFPDQGRKRGQMNRFNRQDRFAPFERGFRSGERSRVMPYAQNGHNRKYDRSQERGLSRGMSPMNGGRHRGFGPMDHGQRRSFGPMNGGPRGMGPQRGMNRFSRPDQRDDNGGRNWRENDDGQGQPSFGGPGHRRRSDTDNSQDDGRMRQWERGENGNQ
jgi:hypothetical protein